MAATRRSVGAALVAGLAIVSCSGGGSKGATASAAGATTTTARASGGTVSPTGATTTIPGRAAGAPPSAPVVGGTLAPVPTTTIPLNPGSASNGTGGSPATPAPATDPATTAAPAPTPASSPPAPAPTSPPVSNGDGDPTAFCAAIDRTLPLYFVTLIFASDQSANSAAYEVAVAPALSGPVHAVASSAPSSVAPTFQKWADRTAQAIGALKAVGATDSQISAFAASYAKQVESATSAGGDQNPPDPLQAAAQAGISSTRVKAAASSFAAANSSYDDFNAALGQALNLTPEAEDDLGQRYPCAAELEDFSN